MGSLVVPKASRKNSEGGVRSWVDLSVPSSSNRFEGVRSEVDYSACDAMRMPRGTDYILTREFSCDVAGDTIRLKLDCMAMICDATRMKMAGSVVLLPDSRSVSLRDLCHA